MNVRFLSANWLPALLLTLSALPCQGGLLFDFEGSSIDSFWNGRGLNADDSVALSSADAWSGNQSVQLLDGGQGLGEALISHIGVDPLVETTS